MGYLLKLFKFISFVFITLVLIVFLFIFFIKESENDIYKINDAFILETLPKVFKLYDLNLNISEKEILFSLYRENKPSPKNMLYINKIDDIIINLETYEKNKNIFKSKFKKLNYQPNSANEKLLCRHIQSTQIKKNICPVKANLEFFNFKHEEEVKSPEGFKDTFSINYSISKLNEKYYWVNIIASSPTFF